MNDAFFFGLCDGCLLLNSKPYAKSLCKDCVQISTALVPLQIGQLAVAVVIIILRPGGFRDLGQMSCHHVLRFCHNPKYGRMSNVPYWKYL